MRTAKRTAGISSAEFEAAQVVAGRELEAAKRDVATLTDQLADLEVAIELSLADTPERAQAQKQHKVAQDRLARAHAKMQRRERVVNRLRERAESARQAATAEDYANVQEDLKQRRRAWLEQCQQAAGHYGPLKVLAEQILGAQFSLSLPSNVRRSLKALDWDTLRWLREASE